MIKHYWPEFLQNNHVFDGIDSAESKEIQDVWSAFNEVDVNQFLMTANEEGIARYERMANIRARPSESLEVRRSRLLNKFSTYVPYNHYWLKSRLDAVLGEGEHGYEIVDDLLKLKTNANEIDSIKSLRRELRQDIPATMDITIGLERSTQQQMHVGSIARVGKITTIIPSNKVMINVASNHNMYTGTYVRTVKKVTINGGT